MDHNLACCNFDSIVKEFKLILILEVTHTCSEIKHECDDHYKYNYKTAVHYNSYKK